MILKEYFSASALNLALGESTLPVVPVLAEDAVAGLTVAAALAGSTVAVVAWQKLLR